MTGLLLPFASDLKKFEVFGFRTCVGTDAKEVAGDFGAFER